MGTLLNKRWIASCRRVRRALTRAPSRHSIHSLNHANVFRVAVFVVSLFSLLARDCLMLGVVHARPVAAAASHDAQHDGQGVHPGDCELAAVKSSMPTASSPITAPSPSPVVRLLAAIAPVREAPGPRLNAQPPLFLLHASFLI